MTSRSNPINPNPCEASPEERENWTDVRELFEQVFPKVGCATANWSMTGGVYPSHPSYPSCPTLAQLCTVPVTHDGNTYTVLLPCPRNRDPNIETGDSVMFQEDFDKNALYIGGHDDPIGTVKWFHGLQAEVPKGWYWVNNSAPASKNTRTGRWAAGFNKYPKNYWAAPGATDPTLGTLGMHCDGGDATLTIDNHAFTPSVSISDHPTNWLTSSDDTNITLSCADSYVGEDCITGLYGVVDMSQHSHLVEVDCSPQGLNAPGSTPVDVPICTDICSSTAMEPGCQSPLSPEVVTMYDACHDHYLYMDCDLTDPGHFHSFTLPPHDVTVSPITLVHSHSLTQQHLPRVFFLLIERLNNSANVSGSPTPAGSYCGAETEP